MPQYTVSRFLQRSLQLINAIAAGDPLEDQEAQDALDTANDFLDALNTQRCAVYQILPVSYALAPGQQTYTLGQGTDGNGNPLVADWPGPRPVRIERANLVTVTGSDQPLRLPMRVLTPDQWAGQIPVQNVQSTLARWLWDDYGYPLSNVRVWPVPTDASDLVELFTWQQLAQLSDLTATLDLPPAYARMLRYNLALELAPEWGKPVDPLVAAIALESMADVKRINAPLLDMACDAAVLTPGAHHFNWLIGE